jgi:hypothetical protein
LWVLSLHLTFWAPFSSSHTDARHCSTQRLRGRDPGLLLRKELIPMLAAATFSTSYLDITLAVLLIFGKHLAPLTPMDYDISPNLTHHISVLQKVPRRYATNNDQLLRTFVHRPGGTFWLRSRARHGYHQLSCLSREIVNSAVGFQYKVSASSHTLYTLRRLSCPRKLLVQLL